MTVTDINSKRAAKKRAPSSAKRASSSAKKPAPAKKAPAKRRKPTTYTPPKHEISLAVDALLASLELDKAGDANAAIARRLAAELDGSYFVVFLDEEHGELELPLRIGADSKSIPALAKELRDVLASIQESTPDGDDDFVADLFSEVGD